MSSLRLVSAGVSAVAVGYGLARYGYGLLLPDVRAELRLSTELLGLIAIGSYAAYLAATVAVGTLAAGSGPRLPVVLGGLVDAVERLLRPAARGRALSAISCRGDRRGRGCSAWVPRRIRRRRRARRLRRPARAPRRPPI